MKCSEFLSSGGVSTIFLIKASIFITNSWLLIKYNRMDIQALYIKLVLVFDK